MQMGPACLMSPSQSAFFGLPSPTGLHSSTMEPAPPTITSTSLGPAGMRQGCISLDNSWPLLASLYMSPNFNALGYQAVVLGSMTPSVTSLASLLPGAPIPGAPLLCLTINQTQSIFQLAAKCQAIGTKLAWDFQALLGLEAVHHNSIQRMAHKMLTLGCLA